MPSTQQFNWVSQSWSGQRKEQNDDAHSILAGSLQEVRVLPHVGSAGLHQEDLFFVVSDGMGGGKAGNIASNLLLSQLPEHLQGVFRMAAQGFYPDYVEQLASIVQEVHQGLNLAQQDKHDLQGMSATLTLAWFTPENLYLAHVGDSRCYVHRASQGLVQLSHDHSFAWAQHKRGQITELAYRKHPRRSALYEVMGGGAKMVNPMIEVFAWYPGDKFLLCTDGIIDGLWNRHIEEYLASGQPLQECLESIFKHAIENDKRDDKTAILISIDELPDRS